MTDCWGLLAKWSVGFARELCWSSGSGTGIGGMFIASNAGIVGRVDIAGKEACRAGDGAISFTFRGGDIIAIRGTGAVGATRGGGGGGGGGEGTIAGGQAMHTNSGVPMLRTVGWYVA
jgi:hypothetical protein